MNRLDALIKQMQIQLDAPKNTHFKQPQWRADNPDDLRQLCHHYNGFIRQQAVVLLGLMQDARAMPDIISCLNDWVVEVRLAAQHSLTGLLINQHAQSMTSCLPELYQLLDCGRDDHLASVNRVVGFLLQPENQQHIISAISDKRPKVARLALQLVIDHHLLSTGEIIELALNHDDVMVRFTAVRLFLTEAKSVSQQQLLIVLHDSFAPIRLMAIEYLNQHSSPLLAKHQIEALLFDHHTRIRSWAIKQLNDRGMDLAAFYCLVLQDKAEIAKKLSCALWGIGAIQHPQAISIVSPFMQHHFPSVRRAALQLLVKLLTGSARDLLLNSVMDISPTVTKEAVRLFVKQQLSLSLLELQILVAKAESPHQFIACNQLANRLNKWDRLIFLLNQISLNHHNDTVDQLYRWYEKFNQSGTQPGAGQIEQVALLIDHPWFKQNLRCYDGLYNILMFFKQ